jgi:hypothetical protein
MRKVLGIGVSLVAIAVGFWAWAGNLDPPGPPGPTMKTLDEIAPTWHRMILDSTRFEIVLGGGAALDHETGLVWELSPAATELHWFQAVEHCYVRTVGQDPRIGDQQRLGWRLPTAEELLTLVDLTQADPALPADHPFLNVLSPDLNFWTITTSGSMLGNTNRSYMVRLSDGVLFGIMKLTDFHRAWCVRGGHGYDYAGQL